MCGRYIVDTEEDIIAMREIIAQINRKFANTQALAAVHYGEIRPTNIAPAIAIGHEGITPGLMTWGIPFPGRKGAIINARAETVFQKPMFRDSIARRRVVIPTTGFYEWTHDEKGKAKERYLFRQPDEKMLYLCGIYSMIGSDAGEKSAHYAILTTAANESMSAYHDRMPVMIAAHEIDTWLLDPGSTQDILTRRQLRLTARAV